MHHTDADLAPIDVSSQNRLLGADHWYVALAVALIARCACSLQSTSSWARHGCAVVGGACRGCSRNVDVFGFFERVPAESTLTRDGGVFGRVCVPWVCVVCCAQGVVAAGTLTACS